MSKNPSLSILLYLLLVAVGCQADDATIDEQSPPESATPADPASSGGTHSVDPAPVREMVPCIVARVIDGDTIECQGAGSVRLIGMDTPEKSQTPYGAQATRGLHNMLVGTKVTLEFDVERRDRYGRLLAYVWADSTMVNLAMVRDGWAVVATYPPNVQYVELLTQAQLEARQEGTGLWGTGGFECLPRDHKRGRC